MNYLDALILVPLLFGLFHGVSRGAISEVIALVAVLLGCIGGKFFGAPVSAWLQTPTGWHHTITDVLAYILIFTVLVCMVRLSGQLITQLIQLLRLSCLNHFFGGVIGITKWMLIVLSVLFLVQTLDTQYHFIDAELRQQSVLFDSCIRLAYDLLSFVRS